MTSPRIQPDLAVRDLVIEPFVAADIRTLFPLMREVAPTLGLQPWVHHAKSLLRLRGRRAGILVARRRANRFPCGAVCYRLDRDIRHGLVLTAEPYITLDLLHPHAVLLALERAIDDIARASGCGAVRAFVPDAGAGIVEGLTQAGYRRDGQTLVKTPAFPARPLGSERVMPTA